MEFKLIIHQNSMKLFLSLLSILLSCTQAPHSHTTHNNSNTEEPIPYTTLLTKVDSIKKSCKNKSKQQIGIIFSQLIGEQLTPYWIGTPWDYNGITQIPNKGYIACGYLVTTLLRDAGVQINRVKMAQCASEQMISSLTTKKENYSKVSFTDFIAKVNSHGAGLSIIGLDNHTGFLYNDGKELYFIHSSFVGDGKVAKEPASENSILQHSSYKVVGYLSLDNHFLQKWLR